MKKHYNSFQNIYQATLVLAEYPIQSDIFQILIESSLDYIQKCYMIQSPGVALQMIQILSQIIEMKDQKQGLKELSDFWKLYG